MRSTLLFTGALCFGCEKAGPVTRPETQSPPVIAAAEVAAPLAKDSPSKDKPTVQPAPVCNPVASLLVGELLDEYRDDAARADRAYSGKCVDITGWIERVAKDDSGHTYAVMGLRGQPSSVEVRCFYDPKKNPEMAGTHVVGAVRGTCRGKPDAIVLADCQRLPSKDTRTVPTQKGPGPIDDRQLPSDAAVLFPGKIKVGQLGVIHKSTFLKPLWEVRQINSETELIAQTRDGVKPYMLIILTGVKTDGLVDGAEVTFTDYFKVEKTRRLKIGKTLFVLERR